MPQRAKHERRELGIKSSLIAIAGDRIWQICAFLALLASVPIGSEAIRGERIDPWLDIALLAASVFALVYGLGRLGKIERRFWQLWAAAMSCWLAARLARMVIPADWKGPVYELCNDCAYLVFFLLLLLAVETTPHHVKALGFDQRLRGLRVTGTTTLIFGLLIYFVVIPRHVKPGVYDSWLPRFDLYVALDLILGIAFALLARNCGNRRWSILYGLLASAMGFWALGDLISGLASAPSPALSLSPALNFIWYVPIVLLIAAARGRSLIRDRVTSTGERSFMAQLGRPVALAAVTLPTIHLLLHAFRLADRDLQHEREILVLIGILLLGALAYVEQSWMHRRIAASVIERRAAAERAIERSTFLDALIGQSPLAITSLDSEYRITLCNPAFESLFGYRQEEILGRSLMRYIMPEGRLDEAWRVGDDVLGGEPTRIVTQRKHRSGRLIDVELLAVPLLIDDSLVGILAFYRDLSEQVRAETARHAVEQRLRRLTESAFEGIAILDGQTIVDANAQLAEMFGYRPGDLQNRPLEALVTPADRPKIPSLLDEPSARPLEIEGLRNDHTTFKVEARARRSDETGEDHRPGAGDVILTIHDLSERQALEAQLRRTQKMEAIGRLAGGIAHDFNNLLTVILGRAELLSIQVPKTSANGLAEIKRAAEQATDLTRQLLVFARHHQPHVERFDLAASTAATTESLLRRLIARDVELEVELATEPALVCADRNLIDQLIVNLGLNAQDAMPDGGVLRFETARVELDESISEYGLEMGPGPAMRLTVKDSGVGIEADLLPKVFDPFFSTKDRGAGLGLATVYGIVRQCGGVIEVESVIGWGTSFHVYLPIDPKDAEASTPTESAPGNDPRPADLAAPPDL